MRKDAKRCRKPARTRMARDERRDRDRATAVYRTGALPAQSRAVATLYVAKLAAHANAYV
jgi:hypothetical protein